jgi:hypothetical protein
LGSPLVSPRSATLTPEDSPTRSATERGARSVDDADVPTAPIRCRATGRGRTNRCSVSPPGSPRSTTPEGSPTRNATERGALAVQESSTSNVSSSSRRARTTSSRDGHRRAQSTSRDRRQGIAKDCGLTDSLKEDKNILNDTKSDDQSVQSSVVSIMPINDDEFTVGR